MLNVMMIQQTNGNSFRLVIYRYQNNELIIQIRYDVADMNLFRSALSACVVGGLTHVKAFLYSNEMAITNNQPAIKTANVGQLSTPSLTVRLPPITLASLNQSLRNFTHGRIQ